MASIDTRSMALECPDDTREDVAACAEADVAERRGPTGAGGGIRPRG